MYKSKYLLAAMSSKIDAVLNYFKISPLNNRKVMEFYKSAVHQAVGMRDDTDKVRERERDRQKQTDRQTERKYMCSLFSIHLITLLYYYTCIYFWINFITKQFLKK